MSNLIQSVVYYSGILEKDPHYHDCHQIILVVSGAAEFFVNNATYRANAGSIVLFSRHENHAVNVLSDQYERFVLQIRPDAGGIDPDVHPLLLNRPAGFCNVVDIGDDLPAVQQLFQQLICEQPDARPLSSNMQKMLLNTLLITIYRHLPDSSMFDSKSNTMVYDIQQLLEIHYSQPYTLEELAKSYNISVSSLCHQFKKTTGVSVMEYLLSCRIASAKQHLTHSNMSIGQIVEACGFSDCSNFCRTFKRLTGCSPSAFRRKYQHTDY